MEGTAISSQTAPPGVPTPRKVFCSSELIYEPDGPEGVLTGVFEGCSSGLDVDGGPIGAQGVPWGLLGPPGLACS